MFWFLLIALVVVVAAVTLFVVGGGSGVSLSEAEPDRIAWPLPADRPTSRADVDAVRLPLALRGYRMTETDDVLDRLGAELAERDARIAELERALAVARAEAARGAAKKDEESPGQAPSDAAPGERNGGTEA
ncbi:DivIVA domain-containing protein [Streptomyces olivoreticuli]|uniref:DivIVA domain-containing protein n=1 Tax=Streptomyces olivoreticuli TaxID=68246 RepID=UPI001F085321|nr:DivIVA domain-containing protein [Streptomyces olivoreticuli]